MITIPLGYSGIIEQFEQLTKKNEQLENENKLLRFKMRHLQDAFTFYDCPECNGIYGAGWVCLNCGFDSSDQDE